MHKYPSVPRVDNEVVGDLYVPETTVRVTEKMDGANFRFTLESHFDPEYQTDDRKIVFGSRNVVYKNETDTDKNFHHAIEAVREQVDPDVLRELEAEYGGQLTVFCESMHPHTLEYVWDESPQVLLFDAYVDGHGWVTMDTLEIARRLNLTHAPVIEHTDPSSLPEDLTDYEIPDSQYRDGVAEGVVFYNARTGVRVKHRSEEFLEKHDTPSPSAYEPTDADELIATYVTEHRIEKQALKLRNEGDYDTLEMPMMADLPEAVLRDVFDEEAWDILCHDWEVDFPTLRSNASSKCASVLKEVIRKREMNDISDETLVTYNNARS